MSFVKEVALTARDWSADEALRVGFVSAVYDTKAAALDKALELGKVIATKSPVAVQGTKEVINYSRDHQISDGESLVLLSVPRVSLIDSSQVSTTLEFGTPVWYKRKTQKTL